MRLLLLLVMVMVLLPVLAAEPPLPTYEVRKVDRDLVISGKADDPLWAQAPAMTLVDPANGAAPASATTVRALYSAHCLYLVFQCEDRYVWSTLSKHDDMLFTEDVVEAFLAPSGSFRSYYEIEVSPKNLVLDSYQLCRSNPDGSYRRIIFLGSYDCLALQTATHVDGTLNTPAGAKGWTVEYAIPFTDLAGRDNLVPNPGDRWRANFCRIDYPAPDKPLYASWSVLGLPDFHRAYRFGTLVFK